MTELSYRPMAPTAADLRLFGACFTRNDSPRELPLLQWQYLENPTGHLLVDFAIAPGDRLAAIYATQPVQVQIRGERVLALQSLDTLTDADYRGKGLFTKLARETYRRAEADLGAAFVYGFPNGSSAPGFFQKLEWASLDPVPFLVRPIRSQYLAGKLSSRLAWLPDVRLPLPRLRVRSDQAIEAIDRFGEEHESLWRAFSAGIGVAVVRDARYLEWRLQQKPGETYQILGVREAGALVALVAYTLKSKHGGQLAYVLELLHAPGRPDAAELALAHALHDVAQQGADAVLAWCFEHSPNRGAYVRSGFLPLPERIRPVELHVGVRRLAAPAHVALGDRRQWYLSYCDSDTV